MTILRFPDGPKVHLDTVKYKPIAPLAQALYNTDKHVFHGLAGPGPGDSKQTSLNMPLQKSAHT